MKRIVSILIGLFLCINYGTTQSLNELPLDSLIQLVSDNAYGIYTNNNASEVHSYAYLCLTRAKKNGGASN